MPIDRRGFLRLLGRSAGALTITTIPTAAAALPQAPVAPAVERVAGTPVATTPVNGLAVDELEIKVVDFRPTLSMTATSYPHTSGTWVVYRGAPELTLVDERRLAREIQRAIEAQTKRGGSWLKE